MSKSRRKRKVIPVRVTNISELGLDPKDNTVTKEDYLFQTKNTYNYEVAQLRSTLESLSQLVGNPYDHTNNEIRNEAFISQMFLCRSSVIQYFIILDSTINDILSSYQISIGIDRQKVIYFQEVDQGVKKFLPKNNLSANFDRNYSRIKHFRTLRNQFSHYRHGTFILESKHESFESFIESLSGFSLDDHGGYHCYFNGKAGMVIPYTIVSPDFISDLLESGTLFLQSLIETLFPE